jgi:hypothetical protein
MLNALSSGSLLAKVTPVALGVRSWKRVGGVLV